MKTYSFLGQLVLVLAFLAGEKHEPADFFRFERMHSMNLTTTTEPAPAALASNKQTEPMRVKNVCFYLQDGVEVLDFAGPMEVFAAAGFKVFTVSKSAETIISQGILKIVPEYSIVDAPPADIMVFFGGNSGVAANDPEVIAWVQRRMKETDYFFSVCSGAFILAKAGILDGLTVTTFHSRIQELQEACPKTKVLANVRYVDNGKVITTAGVSAGIDGALHLVSKLKGMKTARAVAEYMEYDQWIPGKGLIIPTENN